MKKLIVFWLITLILPISSVFAQAPGTCAWHSGVDCNAMADWDGSAICNDGWRDSSETFSSVQECSALHHMCTTQEWNLINQKYDLGGKRQKVSDVSDQMTQLAQQVLPSSNSNDINVLRQNLIQQSKIATQALTLKSQWDLLEGDFWNANNQATRECWALGDDEYQKTQSAFLQQYNALLELTTPPPQQTTASQPIYPPSPDPIDVCIQKLGPEGMVASQSTCGCADGYTLNDQRNSCVKIVVPTPAAPDSSTIKPTTTSPAPGQPSQSKPVVKKIAPVPRIKFSTSTQNQATTSTLTATNTVTTIINIATSSAPSQKVSAPPGGSFLVRAYHFILSFFGRK